MNLKILATLTRSYDKNNNNIQLIASTVCLRDEAISNFNLENIKYESEGSRKHFIIEVDYSNEVLSNYIEFTKSVQKWGSSVSELPEYGILEKTLWNGRRI